jgi:muramoyltetrapeptide carboxypeptidase
MNLLHKLIPGDTIGVFAPGSPTRQELVESGSKWLESLGFKIQLPIDVSKNYGRVDGSFSSDSVQNRTAALNSLLDDKNVKAIISARGAYGTAELLPAIDFKKIASARKALIGYSDVTALVSLIPKLCGIPAIHGPTLTKEVAEANTSEEAKRSVMSLLSLLKGEKPLPLKGTSLEVGSAEGHLVVGNLTVLCSVLGTPYEPDFDGAILVIEEYAESPYRVHRLLMQLKLAGKFDQVAGLALGRFSKCEAKNPPSLEVTLERFLAEQLKSLGIPVLAGLELGHGGMNLPLPCGVKAEIKNDQLAVVGEVVE